MQNMDNEETCLYRSRKTLEEINDHSYSYSNPWKTWHRFLAIFFICLLPFGVCCCFDTPSALEDHIKKNLNITTAQYTLLYSLYSWPNVFLCIIGGVLVDRVFGLRMGTIIFIAFEIAGQIVLASGTMVNNYYIMLFGRLIFGIGGESLITAQSSYAVRWFKGKELNMVFGLLLSICSLGQSFTLGIAEYLYEFLANLDIPGTEVLGGVLYIVGTSCVVAMVCALILGALDKRYEKNLGASESCTNEQFKILDVVNFKVSFWLLCVMTVAFYVSIFSFISIAKEFFTTTFTLSDKNANSLSSLLYIISGVSAPFLGFVIDKTGKMIIWLLFASCLINLAHFLLAFTVLTPYVAIVLMGLGYSVLASGSATIVSLVVSENQLATGYGVWQSSINMGLGVVAIAIGNITDKWGYTATEIFFLITSLVGSISTSLLWLMDRRADGILNMTSGERQVHQKTETQIMNES